MLYLLHEELKFKNKNKLYYVLLLLLNFEFAKFPGYTVVTGLAKLESEII
jgi:hypothetical protein